MRFKTLNKRSFKKSENNVIKKWIVLAFFSLCTQVYGAEIEGTFSAKRGDMFCRGSWEHPFLPMIRNFGGRIPSSPLLANEVLAVSVQQRNSGVKISATYLDGRVESVTPGSGLKKGIRVKQKGGVISIKQFDLFDVILDYGYYAGLKSNIRFKASLQLDENQDLRLENYFSVDHQPLVKKISCILPRVK
jgi:hypothetical protein